MKKKELALAIQRVAKIVLEHLPLVSNAATRDIEELRSRQKSASEIREAISRGEEPSILEGTSAIRENNIAMLQHVVKQPFHAYVKAEVNGGESVYLVMRHGIPPSTRFPGINVCSYKQAAGKVAEERIGEPTEEMGMVAIERNAFTPEHLGGDDWDGINNRFQVAKEDKNIPSLLGFSPFPLIDEKAPEPVAEHPDIAERREELQKQMDADKDDDDKFRKVVIDSLALRDVAFLDHLQGEIFRMPLNSRIAVTGAPGTGKTTLLIKRLAQKTEINYLSQDEQGLIDANNPEHRGLFNAQNWTLFVPSEGLRDYFREAMGHEMIPATSETVKVWDVRSMEIARDIFGYIGVDKALKYNERERILSASSSAEIMACAVEFEKWHEAEIARLLQEAKNQAEKSGLDTALLSRLREVQSGDAFNILRQAEGLRGDFRQQGDKLRRLAESMTHSALLFIPDIVEQVAEIFPQNETDNMPGEDEEDMDGAENKINGREGALLRAKKIIGQTVRRHARGEMGKGKAGEKAWRLWAVMESVLMQRHQDIMPELSELAVERKIVAPLAGGYRNYLNGIPRYYARFRRGKLQQEAEGFFNPDIDARQKLSKGEISADEVDIVNFVMLKHADNLAERAPDNDIVGRVANMRKTQIAVDEAADFSAVQLGCMYYLAIPRFRSFTMVGDLMQRMTQRGIQNFAECREAFLPDLTECQVRKSYRQSRRLTELAAKMYREFQGTEPPFESAYREEWAGPEALLHRANEGEDVTVWIADRIDEIHRTYGKLPSIAVFVPDEEQGRQLQESLEGAMNERNAALRVRLCSDGRMTAATEGVHVIPVEFVKGLEFEGVFFVGLDDVAKKQENLAQHYLYVGITRAAQFLAVIYNKEFPPRLDCIRKDFQENGTWKELRPRVAEVL